MRSITRWGHTITWLTAVVALGQIFELEQGGVELRDFALFQQGFSGGQT